MDDHAVALQLVTVGTLCWAAGYLMGLACWDWNDQRIRKQRLEQVHGLDRDEAK
jgi:hypothetical protein